MERAVDTILVADMKGDQERFIAEGFDGYIAKPVNIQALYRKIVQLVR